MTPIPELLATAAEIEQACAALLALSQPLTEEQRRYTAKISASATRFAHLVTEMAESLENHSPQELGSLSFELRTPLSAIRGFVELFLTHSDLLSEIQREHVTRIKDSGKKLSTLIDTMLDQLSSPDVKSPGESLAGAALLADEQ
jgi:signal transduction histidine kinase